MLKALPWVFSRRLSLILKLVSKLVQEKEELTVTSGAKTGQ